jgi:hypothetical protein
VGSRRMAMNLSPETQSIIVGCVLGDAYLYPNGTLQIEHAFGQADYVWWKYHKLVDIAGKAPVMVERNDPRTGRTYRSLRFYTKAALREFRDAFYEDRRKIVPAQVGDLLDPMALSVWFMDDGGRGARTPKGLVFNTSCYSEREQITLQAAFAERFGVDVSIHRVGRGSQLYVRSKSFDRFVSIVSPYLVPQMRYKLPIDPVTTSSLPGRDGGYVRDLDRTIQYRHNTSALIYHGEMKA